MRNYLVRFTDGFCTIRVALFKPDAIFAGMEGMRIARTMMEGAAGKWTDWRILVEAPGEDRFEETFETAWAVHAPL